MADLAKLALYPSFCYKVVGNWFAVLEVLLFVVFDLLVKYRFKVASSSSSVGPLRNTTLLSSVARVTAV